MKVRDTFEGNQYRDSSLVSEGDNSTPREEGGCERAVWGGVPGDPDAYVSRLNDERSDGIQHLSKFDFPYLCPT